MASVCLYFQLHQPFRVKEFGFMRVGYDHFYEAHEQNQIFLNRVSDRCYLPMNALLLDSIQKSEGKLKVAFSISGTCLEQMVAWRPDVVESFKKLVNTGSVEILAETYYHSLAGIYSASEFTRQVKKHSKAVKEHLGYKPKTFRNTELIYSNRIAELVSNLGFKGIITEGVNRILNGRNPALIYTAEESPELKVLLRNYPLSDDIAFRFCDQSWSEFPLMAPTYAGWLSKAGTNADVVLLGMDYETFGEHRALETGIMHFMAALPDAVLNEPDLEFALPSEVILAEANGGTYDVPHPISWADADKDLSAWLDNNMQQEAISKVYALEDQVMATENDSLIHTWGKLQTSDHFYYMSTRYWNDGVRQAFSPFKSPYQGCINYMNALTDFQGVIDKG